MAENVENKSKRDLVLENVEGQGLDVRQYEAGNESDRLEKVREVANERDDVRFSVGDEEKNDFRSIDKRGKEELAEIADYMLGNDYAAELTGEEFPPSGRSLREVVSDYYEKNYGGKVTREGFGTVLLDDKGVRNDIFHGVGRAKIAAFAAVPEVIKEGVLIDVIKNWKGGKQTSYVIVAPVKIGNEEYVEAVVARGGKESKRLYLHEITLVERENLPDGNIRTSLKLEDSHRGDIAKVLRKIVNAKDEVNNLRKNNGQEQETRFSIDDSNEVYEIIRRAKENGTLGKAPNGQPSKLVEIGNQFGYSGGNKLWARVRTPQFKSWFGDWENGEGSKVLDENGEPLVVYHGSRTGGNFTVFGGESFFTDNRDVAEMFRDDASYIMRVNGGEPVVIFGHDARELAEDLTGGDYDADDLSDWGEIDIDNLGTSNIPQHRKEHLAEGLLGLRDFNDLKTLSIRKAGPVFETFLNIRNPLVVDFANEEWNVDNRVEPSIEEAKKAGYDGIVVRNIVEGGPAAQLLDGCIFLS